MSGDHIVIGHFKHIDATRSAIRKLRELGKEQVELFTPFPNHDLEDEMYFQKPRSPVRRLTMTGGILVCLAAFLMTSWMSLDYPVRVSAKPLVSIPAFVVIAFECTILIGALFNTAAMLHFCRLPNLFRFVAYRPQFSEGTFGLTVRVAKEEADSMKEIFEKGGAEKVEVQYAR